MISIKDVPDIKNIKMVEITYIYLFKKYGVRRYIYLCKINLSHVLWDYMVINGQKYTQNDICTMLDSLVDNRFERFDCGIV